MEKWADLDRVILACGRPHAVLAIPPVEHKRFLKTDYKYVILNTEKGKPEKRLYPISITI